MVRLWNAYTGEEIDTQSISEDAGWFEPLFSDDGKRVMQRTRLGRCYYWAFDPDELPEIGAPRPLPEGYAFLADAGALRPLLLPEADVVSGVWDPATEVALLGTGSGIAAMYNTSTGVPLGAPLRHGGEVRSVALSPDGVRAATGSTLGTVRIWNAKTGQGVSGPWKVSDGAVRKLVFAPDGQELVAFADGEVSSWDVAAGERKRVLYRAPSSQPAGDVSRDGSVVVVAAGGDLRQIDRISGEVLSLIYCGQVSAIAFSPDGRIVAVASSGTAVSPGPSVLLRAVGSGAAVTAPLTHETTVLSLAFSPDGRWLASGDLDGRVHLWNAASGEPVNRKPFAGEGRSTRVTFSQDSRRLLVTFEQGALSYARVWDVQTGQVITEKLAHGSEISNAAFDADASRVLLWPGQVQGGVNAGIASVWDVSIVSGVETKDLAWIPEAATAYGGLRLDDESQLVSLDRLEAMGKLPETTHANRAGTFFQWLAEFPGTRRDSPFRPEPSDAYVESLKLQSDLHLLDEALRLRPRDPVALAKRGALRLRPRFEDELPPGTRTLALADLTKAQLLEPENALVQWFRGIALEKLGEPEAAAAAYRRARELGALTDVEILSVVQTQEAAETDYKERRDLLTEAIEAAGRRGDVGPDLLWRVKRFELSAAHGDFAMAQQDWQVIKEQEDPSIANESLLESYLDAAIVEANRLHDEGQVDAAIALLKPVALIKEIAAHSLGVTWISTDDLNTSQPFSPRRDSLFWTLIQWEFPENSTLIAKGAEWKYLYDGANQGTAWRHPDFDDSSWDSGRAPLGYGDSHVRKIILTGNQDDRPITCYFRLHFNLPEGVHKPFLNVEVLRDDGVVLYLNGKEILRDNMPIGPVDAETLAISGDRGVLSRETHFFPFVIPSAHLRNGKNVVAAEVHQRSSTSSDLGFDLKMTLTDRSIASYLALIVDGNNGSVVTTARDRLPRPLRDAWMRDFNFLIHGETAGTPDQLPDSLWIRRFEFYDGIHEWESGLETVEGRLASLEGKFSAAENRMTKDWLSRKETILTRLFRPAEEIEDVRDEIFAVPPRDPSRDPKQIDLTRYYNASLYDDRGWTESGLSIELGNLPETFVPRKGVSFDIRGLIQLESGTLPDGDTLNSKSGHQYPERVDGVAIGQESPAVHILASCTWGLADAGDEVARFVMRYDDGTSQEMVVRFIEDVADWWTIGGTVPPERVGWHGWISPRAGWEQQVVLSELVWQNPYPEKTIDSIDFISTLGAAAPFLVAITLE